LTSVILTKRNQLCLFYNGVFFTLRTVCLIDTNHVYQQNGHRIIYVKGTCFCVCKTGLGGYSISEYAELANIFCDVASQIINKKNSN